MSGEFDTIDTSAEQNVGLISLPHPPSKVVPVTTPSPVVQLLTL